MIILDNWVVKMEKSEIKNFVSVCTLRTDMNLSCRGCIYFGRCEMIHAYMIRNGLHFKDYE